MFVGVCTPDRQMFCLQFRVTVCTYQKNLVTVVSVQQVDLVFKFVNVGRFLSACNY